MVLNFSRREHLFLMRNGTTSIRLGLSKRLPISHYSRARIMWSQDNSHIVLNSHNHYSHNCKLPHWLNWCWCMGNSHILLNSQKKRMFLCELSGLHCIYSSVLTSTRCHLAPLFHCTNLRNVHDQCFFYLYSWNCCGCNFILVSFGTFIGPPLKKKPQIRERFWRERDNQYFNWVYS